MVHDSERALIASIMAGDRDAFDRLAGQYWEDLWRYAYRLIQDSDSADDLVQDALFALWVKRGQIDVHRGVRGFLFGAVHNRFLEFHRHARIVHRVESSHLPGEVSGAAIPSNPSGTVLDTDLIPILSKFMDDLPDQRRDVLLLRWWHGLRYEEIADATGMGVSAIKMFVRRSAERVRTLMRPDQM